MLAKWGGILDIIIHFVYSLHGGVANVAQNLIQYQVNKGYKVILVYSDDSIMKIESFLSKITHNIETVKFPPKKVTGINMLFGMNINKVYKKYIKDNYGKKVVVHAHNVQTIGLLSKLNKIPLVCTLHGISISSMNNRTIRQKISNIIYRFILKKLNSNNKTIVGVSAAVSNFYNNYIGTKSIITIHNGTEIDTTKVINSKNEFIIGHVGDISYEKGWDVTLEAFSLLPRNYQSNIGFYSAGQNIDFSKSKIRKMICDKNIIGSVKHLGVVNNARSEFIPMIDILVLPSKNEGFGMVLIEALGHGIPILATKVGGIKDILIDGYNGYYVNDENDISKYIIKLHDNKELYQKLSNNAMNDYKERFTVSKMADKYTDEYRKQLKT